MAHRRPSDGSSPDKARRSLLGPRFPQTRSIGNAVVAALFSGRHVLGDEADVNAVSFRSALGREVDGFDPVLSGTWISKHSSSRRVSLVHEYVALGLMLALHMSNLFGPGNVTHHWSPAYLSILPVVMKSLLPKVSGP